MNEQNQRILIAEALGKTDLLANMAKLEEMGYPDPTHALPDYLHDLNAMHEAEKVLTDEQYSKYAWLVLSGTPEREVECREFFSATAAQRAEAFLRTIGKWEES